MKLSELKIQLEQPSASLLQNILDHRLALSNEECDYVTYLASTIYYQESRHCLQDAGIYIRHDRGIPLVYDKIRRRLLIKVNLDVEDVPNDEMRSLDIVEAIAQEKNSAIQQVVVRNYDRECGYVEKHERRPDFQQWVHSLLFGITDTSVAVNNVWRQTNITLYFSILTYGNTAWNVCRRFTNTAFEFCRTNRSVNLITTDWMVEYSSAASDFTQPQWFVTSDCTDSKLLDFLNSNGCKWSYFELSNKYADYYTLIMNTLDIDSILA